MESSKPIFVHSDLPVTFHLYRKEIKEINPINIASACLDYLESNFPSELFFPAFNYDFGSSLLFDVDNDQVQVGDLPEYIRTNASYRRSTCPFFSSLSRNKSQTRLFDRYEPFGAHSVFDYFYKNNGFFMFFGAPFSSFTFLHYIENKIPGGPKYRYDKEFIGRVKNNGELHDVSCLMHVRPKNTNLEYDWDQMEADLIEVGILKEHKLSKSIRYASASELSSFFLSKYEANPSYGLTKESKELFGKLTEGFKYRVWIEDFE